MRNFNKHSFCHIVTSCRNAYYQIRSKIVTLEFKTATIAVKIVVVNCDYFHLAEFWHFIIFIPQLLQSKSIRYSPLSFLKNMGVGSLFPLFSLMHAPSSLRRQYLVVITTISPFGLSISIAWLSISAPRDR